MEFKVCVIHTARFLYELNYSRARFPVVKVLKSLLFSSISFDLIMFVIIIFLPPETRVLISLPSLGVFHTHSTLKNSKYLSLELLLITKHMFS